MDEDAGRQTAHGLLAAVKPAFMLPAVALSAAGAALAPAVSLFVAVAHAAAVAAALYTAHVVDEYVDAHVRGEEAPLLSASACAWAAVGATLAFFALVAALWVADAGLAAVLTLPLWALAVLHAPVLDSHPVTVTVDYPVGVALAFVAGYLAQTASVPAAVLAVAAALAVSLSGLKVAIDRLDREFDATIGKHTLPVLLDDGAATRVAAGIHLLAGTLVGVFVAASVLPPLALAAAGVALADAAAVSRLSPRRAVRAQMALAYPFTAALLSAQCLATNCVVSRFAAGVGLGV